MYKNASKIFSLALILAMLMGMLPVSLLTVQAVSPNIVISQVYGGGGNSGATLTNDFIELFNLSGSAVDVTGWSVQYASATGSTWSVTTLAGVIQPGQYYLVQEAQGSGGTTPLPTPDAIGTISMSATSGKVALVNSTTVLIGSAPTSTTIVDLVGFGTTANFFEGSAAPGLTNTTAALRANGGCQDTDQNAADFSTGTPAPRNSASPAQTCGAPTPTDPSGVGAAQPNLVTVGDSVLLSVAVTPGANPTSTGLTVSVDLGALGGASPQAFYDDGTNGDAAAGDNIFSFQFSVPLAAVPGPVSLPVSISDAEARSAAASIDFTIQAAVIIGADVVISQVYGGGGNSGATYKNDFIELYNRSANPVDISGWSVQYASSSGTSWQLTALSGVLQPGQYYLVQEAAGAGGTVDLPTPDAAGGIAMSGTSGKVALVNNASALSGSCPSVVDFVGYGSANCFEGSGPTPTLSNTTAALRLGSGAQDTNNNAADFAVGPPDPRNTSFGFDAPPAVVSTTPAQGSGDVALDANLEITFSEPVDVLGSWFDLTCTVSGAHSAAVSGGPTTFSLNPDADFVNGDNCTLTVLAAGVSDQDLVDPPDNMEADFSVSFTTGSVCLAAFTPIYDIQGSGLSAAITGSVTTQGVVVSDNEGPSPALRGFYIQDPAGDGNPATSDGIFVFNGNNNNVNLGDVVRVSGSASEYQDQTQISSVTSIVTCGTGSVAPVDVMLPFPSATYLEQYEGMLVRLPQTLTVTEHFQLGRFGQIVMSSDGRLKQPTNVVLPGAPALALQDANNLNRIIIDDALNNQNPDPILFGLGGSPLSASNTLRGGDTATGIVGVMTYTWAGNAASGNAYRVRPINALGGGVPNFVSVNPRPTAAPAVSGSLRVAGMNLLNFFNTFVSGGTCYGGDGGFVTDCRGAYDQTEFDRQWPKTVAAIVGTQADVVGVIEIENDGYGPDSAIQFLVNKLNEATAPGTYALIDVDAGTGMLNALGTDAIKVGLLYKPARVTPVGVTAALNSEAFVNGGDTAPRNRPALAQAFEEKSTGASVVVSVNHLKSKGSACDTPDALDGQGNCNVVRVNAANLLTAWLASDPTGIGDPDALILGDLNSYAKEDPIAAIEGAGYTNLIELFGGPDAYSYVFDGQWGYLDHALASSGLTAQVVNSADWHINSDEPSVLDYNTDFKSAGQIISLYSPDEFRISDHDPILVDLNLNAPPSVDAGGPYSVIEGGSVTLSAVGSDPNGDTLLYEWDLDDNGSYETAGQSVLFQAGTLDGPGSVTVHVRVTDPGGLSAAADGVVNIINTPPTATLTAPTAVYEGAGYTLSLINAFDPSAADTTAGFSYAFDCGTGAGYQSTATNTLTCSALYGFSGVITVGAKIRDKDGGESEYTVSLTILSSNQAKQDVRSSLLALLPSSVSNENLRIGKAVVNIQLSLTPALWLDGSRLSAQGQLVFEREKQAVNDLTKIKNPSAVVTQAITALVEVDRVLAQTAIQNAIAAGGNAKDIAKAQSAMLDAQTQLNAGAFEKAIEAYKKAWQFAVKAVK